MKNRKPYVVGIDPGAKGGIACLRVEANGPPTLLYAEDLPYLNGRPDLAMLCSMLDGWGNISHAYLEKAQVMPARGPDGQERQTGTMGRFNYGVAYGMLLGAFEALEIPLTEVPVQTWKRALHLGKDKDAARAVAKAKFPLLAERFSRVRDDGRAEAALIGLHGVQQWVKADAA